MIQRDSRDPLNETMENKKMVSTAVIVDHEGRVHFHIVSTWWAKGVLLGLTLLIIVCMLLVLLTINNKSEIESLQKQVDTEQKGQ